MRHLVMLCLVCLVSGGHAHARIAAAAERADANLGVWAGSWDGPSSGEFDLTLTKAADGALHGKIAVTAGPPPYTADLQAVALEDTRFSAKYDYPLDDGGEVTLQATFDGKSGKGIWILRPHGQEGEIARGTLALSRK